MNGHGQQPLLALSGVAKTFGGVHALVDVSLEVLSRQIVGIIGPNGAGKTTIFNIITGAYRASKGEVLLEGNNITAQASYQIVRAGISRTFQNIRLFADMTVWEHLLVAQPHDTFSLRRLLPMRWANPPALQRAEDILEFFELGNVRNRLARALPYGMQRRVELARAVTARPRLLLLDEPVAGMNHREADDIRRLILKLRDDGISILVIDHDMTFVMSLCDELYVLDFGIMIAKGRPDEVRTNPAVLDAYLGQVGVMLQIRNLTVSYGAISAVRGIDLDIATGEIVALIGANGAGKTTVARAIAGLLPYQGDILYSGQLLKPNNAERNLRRGIAMVPEGRGILANMTVEENLLMGVYTRSDRAQAADDLAKLQIRFPILAERKSSLAGLLSGGEQQMLSIARALLSKPKLLLLDEPSLGLAPKMTAFVFEMVVRLRDEGLTVLLVEQKARQALKIANRAYLMETGRILASGPAQDLAEDEILSEAFLGTAAAKS